MFNSLLFLELSILLPSGRVSPVLSIHCSSKCIACSEGSICTKSMSESFVFYQAHSSSNMYRCQPVVFHSYDEIGSEYCARPLLKTQLPVVDRILSVLSVVVDSKTKTKKVIYQWFIVVCPFSVDLRLLSFFPVCSQIMSSG